MYPESELLPLSGLQHLLFCPRQWGLIHIEGLWDENRLTAEGRVIHDRADHARDESRPGVRVTRGLLVHSLRLGLSGKADVVEFRTDGTVVPVEYKRGRPKRHHADLVQLCAQALCLEEMLSVPVLNGAMYYYQTRRRAAVEFDRELREETESLAARMHALYENGATPPPVHGSWCMSCSLVDRCMPRALQKPKSVRRYLRAVQRHAASDAEDRA